MTDETLREELRWVAAQLRGKHLPAMSDLVLLGVKAMDDMEREVGKLRRERTKLRELLETATDAWLDGAQLWHDSKLYADYRQAALPKDWYEKARK